MKDTTKERARLHAPSNAKALVVLVAVVSAGIAFIMLKQRKGLHTKKDGRGVYIYAHSKKL